MATTTNYGWTTPDDTALVKDGASAIRTLGSSVDTTTKALNPSTTLGDIEYRSSTANTNTRLGIGTTGQVLAVSGGVPAWTTPAGGGGMTLLSTTTLSGASTTISSISQDYLNLVLVVRNYLPSTTRDLTMQFNGDTANNYAYVDTTVDGGTASLGDRIRLCEDQFTSGTNLIVSTISQYANTTTRKIAQTVATTQKNGTPVQTITDIRGFYISTTAISSITLLLASGTFSSGTALLYGVK
jgi:hypothetical protein